MSNAAEINSTLQSSASLRRTSHATRLDRAIAAIAPGWGRRRVLNRLHFEALATFDAAKRDRTVADWITRNRPADAINLADEPTIRSRARQARRDDWLGAAMVDAQRRDVIGCGITPRAAATTAKGQKLPEFNRMAELRFRLWAQDAKLVDVEGVKNLRQIITLCQSEKFLTGNAFIILGVERRENLPALTLQMFETDQLADYMSPGVKAAEGNAVKGGIEVDKFNRPVAYWVYTEGQPFEDVGIGRVQRPIRTEPQRITADRVLHLRTQDRVRETLSVSRLATVLRKMWDRSTYDGQELLAKKKESFLAFAIETNPEFGEGIPGFSASTGQITDPGDDSDRQQGTYREIAFEPGLVPVTYPGEKFHLFNPTRPGPQYDKYMRKQVAMCAAGVGRSPASISREYEGSYSAARQGLIDDYREIDCEQADLIDMVLRPIWERFILLEVLAGELTAPGFFDSAMSMKLYTQVEWGVPPRPWIDPAKEAAAAKIQLDYRLETRAAIANRANRDWREMFDQLAEEQQYAEQRGITLPEDAEAAPAVSPSEPKPHGVGDEESDVGESPRTQSSNRLVESILASAFRDE